MLELISSRFETRTPAVGMPSVTAVSDIILLAGAIRPTPLLQHVQRPILDLPLGDKGTILDLWRHQALETFEAGLAQQSSVRVLVDGSSIAPSESRFASMTSDLPAARIQTDPSGYRGTAGVLRDCLLASHASDEYVLIASAAQMLFEPLAEMVEQLFAADSDVAMFSHPDGAPVGLMLLRVGCLAGVPEIGYFDLKEQALPLIARRHSVKVLPRRFPIGTSIKTLEEYILAHRWVHGGADFENPFFENWSPSFLHVESGAEVHPSAQLFDSVVLRGAKVERNATVVRSVICPGGVVRKESLVTDRLVSKLGETA